MEPLSKSLEENLDWLKSSFGNTADCYTKKIRIAGVECAICLMEGLGNLEKTWELLLKRIGIQPLLGMNGEKLFSYIMEKSDYPTDKLPVESREDLVFRLTAGMTVILLDGYDKGFSLTTQAMAYRSVSAPSTEGNVLGSQEGFTELVRVNVSLIRRLIRTTDLCVEYAQLGQRTRTEYALCYNQKLVPPKLLEETKEKLEKVKLPFLLDSAYLIPFLRRGPFHLFSGMGNTERPAVAAAKLCEGKIIILVNGSPFALILPTFFAEHFESLDDYSTTALFASTIRLLKYTGFFLAILLPAVYVMAVRFLPEALPYQLLTTIAKGEADTPFPITMEMLMVLVVLEIIREAGLRMPKQLGHSVSLVAAVIIGDTAVKAGIMSVPVIAVAAIAAIATYVIPSLYEQVTMLRFGFVLLGGYLGVAGLAAGLFVLVAMVCGDAQGYPYSYPIVPWDKGMVRDGIFRSSWKVLAKNDYSLRDIKQEDRH